MCDDRAGAQPIRCVRCTGTLTARSPLKPFVCRAGGNSKKPWLFLFVFKKGSNKSGSSFASVNRSWSRGADLECAAERERAGHGPCGWRMEEKGPGAEPGAAGARWPAQGLGGPWSPPACWGSGEGAHDTVGKVLWSCALSRGKRSAARGSLPSNAEALRGMIVIIIALKQSTKSLLLWRDH